MALALGVGCTLYSSVSCAEDPIFIEEYGVPGFLDDSNAPNGGDGGNAPGVEVSNSGEISTTGSAIRAASLGGGGGAGKLFSGVGTNGGHGGDSGNVTVTNHGNLSTSNESANGINVLSQAGNGGNGFQGVFGTDPADGHDGRAGRSGNVHIVNSGEISVAGENSRGVYGRSLGGSGGSGGFYEQILEGPTGLAGTVTINNSGGIVTHSDVSGGIVAQSVGGFSTEGSSARTGGDDANGGHGERIEITNSAAISTQGKDSFGISAQSIGGGGGHGADAGGSYAVGGSGSEGGNGGTVQATLTEGTQITATGERSAGLILQSIGGGGGSGGNASASGSSAVAIGGSGGQAGHGDLVELTMDEQTTVHTQGERAIGIIGQSIGGGGGVGGHAHASGHGLLHSSALAIGGQGGGGGSGGMVDLDINGHVSTTGLHATGVLAQSIGGGGGAGGTSVAHASALLSTSSHSIGGVGGAASAGGQVSVTGGDNGSVTTEGEGADGILAQSIGGGGGNGGAALAVAESVGFSKTLAVGGAGGNGSHGDQVEVNTGSMITTLGDHSAGIRAQSIGGGGGSGGASVSLAGSLGGSLSQSVGGTGGAANNGGIVNVTTSSESDIMTSGYLAPAIQAQSIGGGGGNGGSSTAGAIGGIVAVSSSVGGKAGGGGQSAAVTVNVAKPSDLSVPTSFSTITTLGEQADGIQAQSIGGGGGNGGASVAGSASLGLATSYSVGGQGGDGGHGSDVTLYGASHITTNGSNSYGIRAQSIGGGGGNGGYSAAGAATIDTLAGAFSVGGAGGNASHGGKTDVTTAGQITTHGANSGGVLAQSIGGGGGTGGVSGALSASLTGGAGSLAIGGSGGLGGNGGEVVLANNANVDTDGDNSVGVMGHSIGGGGGSGGMSIAASGGLLGAASVSVGGSGAHGGDASSVEVTSTGDVSTAGKHSHGVQAQSVGGGGGNGGVALSGTAVVTGGSVTASIGGSAGAGGHGSAVTLTNSGDVTTQGDSSHSITAQSIGGGGGHGGFAASLSASVDALATASVTVGGSGEPGGDADSVAVTSTGSVVSAHGIGSNGIHAQSIGGGGGDGGFAASATLSSETVAKASATLGGSGGDGGSGSTVDITNSSVVDTGGDFTAGILAQSIGGGGGSGGFTASLSASVGGPSADIKASLGGNGADGNGAAKVKVANNNDVQAKGRFNAAGIKAQSIGGGGGSGGFAFTGGVSTSATKNLDVSVGGSGGSGGVGGEVEVTHSIGMVSTAGILSDGIMAQSVGGGGGHGGAAATVQLGATETGNTINAGVDVGGQGGTAQFGNTVTVTNNANITTAGVESRGIFAQSVGGSGGSGGKAFTLIAELDDSASVDPTARTTNLAFTVGGKGGDGNIGGDVTATSSGSITTESSSSHGIYAQSVGGGGGEGGSAHSKSLILGSAPDGPPAEEGEEPQPTSSSKDVNASITAEIGGNGGTGNDGGIVSTTNSGDIEAKGVNSMGIFAQSIGGGGGNGGNGVLGTGEHLFEDATNAASLKYTRLELARNLSVTVGGNGAVSGDGGMVTATNSGEVITHEAGGHGMFAQSLGGGGGVGGAASIGFTGEVGIGGAAGAAGNGGETTVKHTAGSITTYGHASSGIFAQSIGGGGGTAGNINRALAHTDSVAGVDVHNMGVNVGYARGGGGGGDGGGVTIMSESDITTSGEASYGIFAQSVGGGGGVAGTLGNELLQSDLFDEIGQNKEDWSLAGHVGSVGDAGSGGMVQITQEGGITTNGERAHAILAQSAGGKGMGSSVTLNLKGEVRALHSGTYGVLAQSVGLGGNGDITVHVNSGVVAGGADGGGGILFKDGQSNMLENHGVVTTTSGALGNAVVGTTGSEHIDNFGTLIGSVRLGGGTNSLTNQTEGTIHSGSTIDLDSTSATFHNDGLLSPGGTGGDSTLMTTHITGSYTQSASGTLELDFDLGENAESDHLVIDGSADVAGTLRLNPINANLTASGDRTHVLVTSAGTVTTDNLNLEVPESIVVRYDLATPSANEIAVTSSVNFAPTGLEANEQQVGLALNQLRANGESDALDQLVAELAAMPTEVGLASAYQQMVGDVHSANQSVEQMSSSSMNQVLSQQLNSLASLGPRAGSGGIAKATDSPARSGNDIQKVSWEQGLASRHNDYSSRYDWYGWTTGYGAGGSFGDIEYRFAGALTGIHRWTDDRTIAGAFMGMGHNATEDDLARQNSVTKVTQIGAYLRRESFNSENYFLLTSSWGYSDLESERIIQIGSIRESAQGDSHGGQASVSLQLGTAYELPNVSIAPWTTLQYTYVYQHGFQEFGAGPLNLVIDDSDSHSLRSTLGASFVGTNLRWRPTFRVGWLHEYLADDYLVRSQFASINTPIAFSDTAPELPRDMLLLGAGLTPIERDRFLLRANYDGQFSGDQVLHTGSLTAEYAW